MQIQVDYGQLNSIAQLLGENAEVFQKEYESLYELLSNISAVWQGEEQAAFQEASQSYYPKLVEFYNLQVSLMNFLHETASLYERNQGELKDAARGLIIS